MLAGMSTELCRLMSPFSKLQKILNLIEARTPGAPDCIVLYCVLRTTISTLGFPHLDLRFLTITLHESANETLPVQLDLTCSKRLWCQSRHHILTTILLVVRFEPCWWNLERNTMLFILVYRENHSSRHISRSSRRGWGLNVYVKAFK